MRDSPSDPSAVTGIPFSFFVSLVREIGKLKPISTKVRARVRYAKKETTVPDYPALMVFKNWVNELRRRFTSLPPGTTAICFRLLFPEEDWKRKYNIQEARLTKLLADCYGWGGDRLDGWRQEENSGCLGDELKHALQRTCPYEDGYESPMSITQVSELLDQLAALSKYSNLSIKNKRGNVKCTAKDIIRKLFRPLAPLDAAVMAQIILKDLRPLLYPLTEFHYTTALINFNTASVKMLVKEHAMNVWDPSRRLTRYYHMRSSLDEAAAFADNPENTYRDVAPAYGHPIAVPKSEKGQNISHALKILSSAEWVWAETKYDGERAQIHVRIKADGTPDITIFSKSRRDSTRDRVGVRSIILRALGLTSESPGNMRRKPAFKKNIIIDAEMVAFSGDEVAEFYHITRLIGATAEGERAQRSLRIRTKDSVSTQDHDQDSYEAADKEHDETVSLGLVFFDVLYLDSESQMGRPYSERRELLESLIYVSPGSAILASRWLIPMSDDITEAEDTLRWIFSHHIASHKEGLVLKASESYYNDYNQPWVKLKKDYIPGHGDSVDMVIVGASWEKIRGRSLRVPPSTYTTFLVAALDNKNEINRGTNKPSFGSYFTVCYGLDRRQLEDLNFRIKSSSISFEEYHQQIKSRTNTLWIDNIPRAMEPTVVLREPLLVELFGAGFTKAAYSHYYELRFPRISKIYRPIERNWREGLSCDKLNDIARASVGRDSRAVEMANEGRTLFGQPLLPSVKSKFQYRQRLLCAYNELSTSEGKVHCDSSSLQIVPEFSVDSRTPDSVETQSLARPLLSKTNILVRDADRFLIPSFASTTDPELTLSIPRPPSIALEATTTPQSLKQLLFARNPAKLSYPMQSNPSMPFTPPPSSPIAPQTKPLKRRSDDLEAQTADHPVKRAKTGSSLLDPERVLPSPVATCRPTTSPPDIELDSTFVHFALPRGSGCVSFRASKKLVERPVHGMRSILHGSGWLDQWDGVREDVYKAVIIIDECDTSAAFHWNKIRTFLEKEAASPPKTRRLPVLVYGCHSADVLARYN